MNGALWFAAGMVAALGLEVVAVYVLALRAMGHLLRKRGSAYPAPAHRQRAPKGEGRDL